MRSMSTPSSALGFGLCLGALLLVRYPEARAQDVKQPPAKETRAEGASSTRPTADKQADRATTGQPDRASENRSATAVKKDVSAPKKDESAAKKDESAAKKDAAKKRAQATDKSDADLAARRPPPAPESLEPRRTKFKRVKTGETGVGQAHDESDKLARPAAAADSAPVAATAPANESDEKLRERVQATLLSDRKLPYTARMVSVAVEKGTITLSGEVNTDYERARVSQVVDGMRGRHDVVNQISVRNRSPEAVQATSR